MRRLVLHVMVALLAFVVGVSAAALLGGLTGHTRRGHYKRVYFERHFQPARDCPYSRRMSELPPPPPLPPPAFDLPDAPAPPPPPAPALKPGEVKRFRIRGEDGKEHVVVVQQSADVN